MPGFGHGPFGQYPAGTYKWSRQVLWDYLPELHRRTDADTGGGKLEAWTEGIGPSFDSLKTLIRDYGDLRNPLAARSQYDQAVTLTLGPVIQTKGELLQRGVGASVDASWLLTAPTARFYSDSVGKELTISKSAEASNNRVVRIATVFSPTTVATWPSLDPDSGLSWELREPVAVSGSTTVVDVEFGDVSGVSPGWILSDGYSEYEVLARQTLKRTTEREGSDGSIDSSGRFVLLSGQFTLEDIGKRITVFDSGTATNNGIWEIRNVVTDPLSGLYTIAILDTALALDNGPFLWAMRSRPQLTLKTTGASVRGVAEQLGFDAVVTAVAPTTATFSMPSANFSSNDILKWLTLHGPGINTGSFQVAAVDPTNPNLVTVLRVGGAPSVVDLVTNLEWELRSSTKIGDARQVQLRATSLLSLLADDFAIQVDKLDNNDRQRSWVEHVSRWINRKGDAKSYSILGAISGYNITPYPLYHLSSSQASNVSSIDPTIVYEVGSTNPLQYGNDGSLVLGELDPYDGMYYLLVGHFKISSITSQVVVLDPNCGLNIQDPSTLVSAGDPVYIRVNDFGTSLPIRYTVASVSSPTEFTLAETISDQTGGYAIFSELSGVHFHLSDIDKQARITNSLQGPGSPPANNQSYWIIDADPVIGCWALVSFNTAYATVPDPPTGPLNLGWAITKFYTTEPPTKPYASPAQLHVPGKTGANAGMVTYQYYNALDPNPVKGDHIRVRCIQGTGLTTSISIVKATLKIPGASGLAAGDILYTAKTSYFNYGGLRGNYIKVKQVQGVGLSVLVSDDLTYKTVTVTLPLAGATAATVASVVNGTSQLVTASCPTASGSGTAGVLIPFTALSGGVDDITVELPVGGATALAVASAVVASPDCTNLMYAFAGGTDLAGLIGYSNLIGPDFSAGLMAQYINPHATLQIFGASLLADSNVTYTATVGESSGNYIQVEHIASGGLLTVSLSSLKITVALEMSGGNPVSTAAQVVAAVNANPAIRSLVTASHGGTTGSEYAGLRTVSNLTGGAWHFNGSYFVWKPTYSATIPSGVLAIPTVPTEISANKWDVTWTVPTWTVVSTSSSPNRITVSGPPIDLSDWALPTNAYIPEIVIEGGPAAGTYTKWGASDAFHIPILEPLPNVPVYSGGTLSIPMDFVPQIAFNNWWFQDSAGSKFYLESVPVRSGSTYHTTVYAATPPAVGPITLTYDGVTQPSCDYCAASKVLLIIEPGAGLSSTSASELEQVQNRMLDRIVQVTPAHVETVPRFRLYLTAYVAPWTTSTPPTSANITVTFGTKIEGALLIAPLTALYDDVPGDAILYSPPPIAGPATVGGTATVEDSIMITSGGATAERVEQTPGGKDPAAPWPSPFYAAPGDEAP